MLPPGQFQNGAMQHWVMVRPEPAGQFTAYALGLPEVRATAATREEALSSIQQMLASLLATGQLVPMQISVGNSQRYWTTTNPNDPAEQAYLEALARERQQDLENTLRELD